MLGLGGIFLFLIQIMLVFIPYKILTRTIFLKHDIQGFLLIISTLLAFFLWKYLLVPTLFFVY